MEKPFEIEVERAREITKTDSALIYSVVLEMTCLYTDMAESRIQHQTKLLKQVGPDSHLLKINTVSLTSKELC